jgi:2-(1,2-epoxy-1,2-dihydrophenyl)acetyl-CoA isomerase
MDFKTVILKKEGNIATIVLNRPESLNALSMEAITELPRVLKEVREDDEVRAVIVTGAGRAFCAGFDLETSVGETSSEILKFMEGDVTEMVLSIRNMPKAVIAAVNGAAAGAGCNIALACDIILASEKARFGEVFVLRGLHPDCGGTYFLPRLVGVARACELILTGRMVDASEVERMGMINRVVPPDQLESASRELASTLAKHPPLAIKAAKASLYQGLSMDLAGVLEREAQMQSILMVTEDFKESVDAFLGKREPIFKGK